MATEESFDVNPSSIPTLTVLIRGVPFTIPREYVKNFQFFASCDADDAVNLTPDDRKLSFDVRAWPNIYNYIMTQGASTKVTVPEDSLPVADAWYHMLSESERLLFGLTHVDVATSQLIGVDIETKANEFVAEWEKVMNMSVDEHQIAQRNKLNEACAILKNSPGQFANAKKLVVPTNEYMADLLGRLRYISITVLFFLGGKGQNEYSDQLVKCCAATCAWCLTGRTVKHNEWICERAKLLCNGSPDQEPEWTELDVDALKALSAMFN